MAAGVLPEEGELQLGSVRLPPGRRLTAGDSDAPVAWVTIGTVPDPGLVWAALSDLHGQTGLVPVVLNDGLEDLEDLFMEPCDVDEAGRLDPAELLAARWEGAPGDDDDDPGRWEAPRVSGFPGRTTSGDEPGGLSDIVMAIARLEQDPDADAELSRLSELDRQDIAPEYERSSARSHERQAGRAWTAFPGLAPPVRDSLSSTEQVAALRSIRSARIGLIPAERPADVLPVVGWSCFDDPAYDDGIRNAVWIAAVLRSWEERFGARLLAIGPAAEIRLLVQRPPRTMTAAGKLAEEHSAFCTECAGQGLRTVQDIAPALLNAPIWTFWWD